jgi:hypothetical protein
MKNINNQELAKILIRLAPPKDKELSKSDWIKIITNEDARRAYHAGGSK